jgi:hypothetical protein
MGLASIIVDPKPCLACKLTGTHPFASVAAIPAPGGQKWWMRRSGFEMGQNGGLGIGAGASMRSIGTQTGQSSQAASELSQVEMISGAKEEREGDWRDVDLEDGEDEGENDPDWEMV